MTFEEKKNFRPSRTTTAKTAVNRSDRAPASGFHFPNDPRSCLITG